MPAWPGRRAAVRALKDLPRPQDTMRVFSAALVLDFLLTSALAWRVRRALAS